MMMRKKMRKMLKVEEELLAKVQIHLMLTLSDPHKIGEEVRKEYFGVHYENDHSITTSCLQSDEWNWITIGRNRRLRHKSFKYDLRSFSSVNLLD